MISIVLQEREGEHGVSPVIQNEKLGQNAHGSHTDTGGLDGQDVGDHKNQGTVAKLLSAVTPEHAPDDDQLGEHAQHYTQFTRSGGGCWLPGSFFIINVRQLQREPEETWRLTLAPFTLVQQRSPQTGLVLSRPS